jgi:hypothetical protein
MDDILSTEEFMEEEFLALQHEHKVDFFFLLYFQTQVLLFPMYIN